MYIAGFLLYILLVHPYMCTVRIFRSISSDNEQQPLDPPFLTLFLGVAKKEESICGWSYLFI